MAGWAFQYDLDDDVVDTMSEEDLKPHIRPVAFVSRRLKRTERLWNKPSGKIPCSAADALADLQSNPEKIADIGAGNGITELECLAALFLVEQVSDFIEGARRSILRTDHKHIIWLLQSSNSRVVRWALKLSAYPRLLFRFQKGSKMVTSPPTLFLA